MKPPPLFFIVCLTIAGVASAQETNEAEQPQSPQPRIPPVGFLQPSTVESAPLDHKPWTPKVYDAVMSGDAKLLHRLLEAGVPASSVELDHDTPLCAALRTEHDDLAADLLLHGADATAKGALDESPAALASLRRHPLLMRMLLAAGADPNAAFGKAVTGTTLAHVATPLLTKELKREQGLTPLMICTMRGDVECVALLLAYGADTQKRTEPRHRYAIEFAADQGFLYIMRLLLGRKPDSEPHVLITVNLENQRAKLQIDGETKLSTSVSTGRSGYATPAGRYVITNKYKEWNSTIYKVPMPYFLRLNCGPIGLHSGYVTGSPASHGCIRLPNEMALQFYKLARVGDEVIIED